MYSNIGLHIILFANNIFTILQDFILQFQVWDYMDFILQFQVWDYIHIWDLPHCV